jgi:integrase
MLWLQIGTDRLTRGTGAVLGPLAVAGPDPGKRVGEIFKTRAKAVGLEGSGVPGEGGVSGHSLRVGAAQDLLAAGFGLPAIQQAGDWTSPTMPARYGERIAAGTGAMAQLAEKQGRSSHLAGHSLHAEPEGAEAEEHFGPRDRQRRGR